MNKKTYFIKPKDYDLAGYASSDVKKILKQMSFERHLIKRICSSSYEAEINVVIHSYGGIMSFSFDESKVELEFIDYGPGIEDIELAMQEGYSTASDLDRQNGFGAGMGLVNIQRQADHMEITSSPNGTTLKIFFERHV